MRTHAYDADVLPKCKLEEESGKFVDSMNDDPVLGSGCINCKRPFAKGFVPISHVSISFIPASHGELEDQPYPEMSTCSLSSDKFTNITIFDALLSIFTSSNLIHLKKSQWKNELLMCFKCAQVLSNLYQSYIELLSFSHPAGDICQFIHQIGLWHNHGRGRECELDGEHEILEEEAPDPFTRFTDAILEFDSRKAENEINNSGPAVKVKEVESHLKSRRQNSLMTDVFFLNPHQITPSPLSLPQVVSSSDVCVSRRSGRIAVQKEKTPSLKNIWSRNSKKLQRKCQARNLIPNPELKDKSLEKTKQLTAKNESAACGKDEEDSDFFVSESPAQKIKRKKGLDQNVRCPIEGCPKKFLFYWVMENHIQLDHEKKVPKKCAGCEFECVDLHRFDSHNCNKKRTETVPWRCDFCGIRYARRDAMLLHARTHDRSVLKCHFPGCGESFLGVRLLKKHEKSKHRAPSVRETQDGKQCQCSECGKVFNSKQTFKIHMEIHSSVRKYLCKTCGMSFKQKRALTRHGLIHKELDAIHLYQCPLCGRCFKRKYNLTQHYHSKVHPQFIIKKILNGEALCEDELKNSSLKRRRVTKTKNVVLENHLSEPTSVSTSTEMEETVMRNLKTNENPCTDQPLVRFIDSNPLQYHSIDIASFQRINANYAAPAPGKKDYPIGALAQLDQRRMGEVRQSQRTLELSQFQVRSPTGDGRTYAASHFLPI